jgi:hypothetical protein
MRISWFVVLGLFTLLLSIAGCSASATATPPTATVTFTPPSSCMTDSTVTCGDAATGYSCSSTDTPDDADSSIECSIGVVDGANTDYCCLPGSAYSWSTTTCAQDDSLACTTPGSFGFSCAAGDNPMTYDSTLTCSAPGSDTSGDHFCCASGIAGVGGGSSGGTIVITTGCSVDQTVTGCSGTSTGYSCTGTEPPDQADPTLECSIGVADPTTATDLDYCCLTGEVFVAGTCQQDDTITSICTTPGSYGFKCAAMDTPDQTDSTLVCSMGVADADGTSTDFCCTP